MGADAKQSALMMPDTRCLRAFCLAVLLLGRCDAFQTGMPTAAWSARRGCVARRPSRPSPRLTMMALTQDMSDVLKRYGVPQEDHAALVKELAPLISTAFGAAKPAKLERLDVTVTRGESGGLGIDVDKSNVIAVVRGQPQLQVGDRLPGQGSPRADG